MVYRLNLEATWRFARMLAVTASHQSSLQREGPDSMRREDTFHSGFLLGLVAGTTGN
jgi:hypothetical protein